MVRDQRELTKKYVRTLFKLCIFYHQKVEKSKSPIYFFNSLFFIILHIISYQYALRCARIQGTLSNHIPIKIFTFRFKPILP